VTDNHQEGNARGLEAIGAARVVLESELDARALHTLVSDLLSDPAVLKAMGQAARSQARLDSAERVAELVDSVLLAR